jgi:hypothetical protein
VSYLPETSSVGYEKEISRGFDNQNKNEATINSILDVIGQIDKFLDRYLFASEYTEETVTETGEEEDPITHKVTPVKKSKKIGRYKHLPSEERIVGCRLFETEREVSELDPITHQMIKVKRNMKIDCHKRNFQPDTTMSYSSSLDPDIFEGQCVTYVEDREGAYLQKLVRLQKHMQEEHKIQMNTEDLAYNSRWLTWSPMFRNRQGFDAVKSYIMLKVAPLMSTTIIPDKKSRLGVDSDEMINNQAVDAARINVQDVILRHREYGFDLSPTKIIELLNLEADLFRATLQRNLNGIAIRGIINTIEQREVNIKQENVGTKSDQSGGVFNRIINR